MRRATKKNVQNISEKKIAFQKRFYEKNTSIGDIITLIFFIKQLYIKSLNTFNYI